MAERYLYKAKFRICVLAINAISTTRLAIQFWVGGKIFSYLILFLLCDFL